MTIKGFGQFLKKLLKIKNIINKKNLKDYKNKTIAIDTSLFIYKALYYEKSTPKKLEVISSFPKVNFFIYFMNLINLFKKNEILPIFILDDKKTKNTKKEITKRREKIKEKNEKELKKMIKKRYSKELIEKQDKKILKVSDNHIILLKKLFRLTNCPYFVAVGEAEQLCSDLTRGKTFIINDKNYVIKVDAVLSNDYDCFVCGSKIVLRNMNNTGCLEEIKLKDLMGLLGFKKRKQIIDFAILSGTDFNPDGNFSCNISREIILKYGKIVKPSKLENEKNIWIKKRLEEYKKTYKTKKYRKIRKLFRNCEIKGGKYKYSEKKNFIVFYIECKNEREKLSLYLDVLKVLEKNN